LTKLTEFIGIKDRIEEDWTFAGEDTRYMTHGFHLYPARMMPLIAKRLIRRFAQSQDDVILDPFVGSGGVLVEARLHNRNAVGVDINPLAILIARAKTQPIDPKVLREHARKLFRRTEKDVLEKVDYGVPDIKNVKFWFKTPIIRKLNIIRHHLDDLKAVDENVYDFFACAFSYAVRKTSSVRPREYKLYRIADDELPTHNPDVLAVFREIVDKNISKMHDYYNAVKGFDVRTSLLEGDTRRLNEINPLILHDECASLVVTSPPYGDAHTTVAYGQFSRYPALWLGFDEEKVLDLDDTGLGGQSIESDVSSLDSATLTETFEKVKERDEVRAKELLAFFYDIDLCMKQIGRALRGGRSHCCFVLGNRTMRRVKIPADRILIEMSRKHAYQHVETKYRDIPTKRIPWVNAPENVPGRTVETMAKESIIIWSL